MAALVLECGHSGCAGGRVCNGSGSAGPAGHGAEPAAAHPPRRIRAGLGSGHAGGPLDMEMYMKVGIHKHENIRSIDGTMRSVKARSMTEFQAS